LALFAIMLGAIGYLNDWTGAWSFVPGAVLLAYMFFGWFSTVIGENQHGVYNLQVNRSFRMGMMWFIFSEVMFFAAFFGALFYARMLSVPWLGGEGVKVFSNFILWPQFEAVWPTNGPGHVGGRADATFGTIPAIGVPALNTAILLTSGLTVTFAHFALRAGRRGRLALFLALTFLLGFTFVGLQAREYGEAYRELGLRLSTGIYGSTCFLRMGRRAAGLQGVGRDQPQVPGQHQQREQHQRHGDANGQGARHFARIVGTTARQMKQPEAEARDDPSETRQDQQPDERLH